MEQDWLESYNPRSLDRLTACSLAELGKKLREVAYPLTDEETGALRNKSYRDSSGYGTVMGVIVDGERLRATTTALRGLMDSLPRPQRSSFSVPPTLFLSCLSTDQGDPLETGISAISTLRLK